MENKLSSNAHAELKRLAGIFIQGALLVLLVICIWSQPGPEKIPRGYQGQIWTAVGLSLLGFSFRKRNLLVSTTAWSLAAASLSFYLSVHFHHFGMKIFLMAMLVPAYFFKKMIVLRTDV